MPGRCVSSRSSRRTSGRELGVLWLGWLTTFVGRHLENFARASGISRQFVVGGTL
jgi:hypothetical protein